MSQKKMEEKSKCLHGIQTRPIVHNIHAFQCELFERKARGHLNFSAAVKRARRTLYNTASPHTQGQLWQVAIAVIEIEPFRLEGGHRTAEIHSIQSILVLGVKAINHPTMFFSYVSRFRRSSCKIGWGRCCESEASILRIWSSMSDGISSRRDKTPPKRYWC
ncbi:hypothetical protein PILCRDRAFT_663377 [Piloderma croceum F 1598]|uniref:Uncharacterized protein n=1 Tax=Piloderma croceum (strain F 1598) TaxID=765440 RepID=A0A0C3APP1_PILCF|nr:hypothetical protein PILCRDRAFT_663377 [Piloderma croceum F 1598]